MTAAPTEGNAASPLHEARTILSDYLKAHTLRNTPERVVILTHIYESTEGPFTAEQLLHEVCEQRLRVSNATIFYALDLFYRLGLVIRVPLGDKMLYDKCLGQPLMHFFQSCVRCGEVRRVEAPQVEEALQGVTYRRLRTHGVALCSFGTCAKCRSALTKAHNRYLRSVAQKKKR